MKITIIFINYPSIFTIYQGNTTKKIRLYKTTYKLHINNHL